MQHHGHKTLADSIAEPELIFEHAPVGLMVTRNRIIERCNLAMATMFGYERVQLVGQTTERLYPSHEEFEYIGERGAASMQQTGTYRDQRIMRHADGRMFWCAVSGRSFSPEAPYASVIWVFEDISDSRPVSADLTAREREIAARVITGLTAKEIARDLNVSHRTVEAHRMRLMRKLGVTTTGELIARILGMPGVH
ncbi:MAG: PAS and helix-turn-helix domain-containing protein [Burkholderiales bacterium]|jgi:PAS domain S-box-containing protein|nr:PAS and helix-turn-helix domain-containing protein [Burkholderiales bacterium]